MSLAPSNGDPRVKIVDFRRSQCHCFQILFSSHIQFHFFYLCICLSYLPLQPVSIQKLLHKAISGRDGNLVQISKKVNLRFRGQIFLLLSISIFQWGLSFFGPVQIYFQIFQDALQPKKRISSTARNRHAFQINFQ